MKIVYILLMILDSNTTQLATFQTMRQCENAAEYAQETKYREQADFVCISLRNDARIVPDIQALVPESRTGVYGD